MERQAQIDQLNAILDTLNPEYPQITIQTSVGAYVIRSYGNANQFDCSPHSEGKYTPRPLKLGRKEIRVDILIRMMFGTSEPYLTVRPFEYGVVLSDAQRKSFDEGVGKEILSQINREQLLAMLPKFEVADAIAKARSEVQSAKQALQKVAEISERG